MRSSAAIDHSDHSRQYQALPLGMQFCSHAVKIKLLCVRRKVRALGDGDMVDDGIIMSLEHNIISDKPFEILPPFEGFRPPLYSSSCTAS